MVIWWLPEPSKVKYKYKMALKRPICKTCNKSYCAINYKRDGVTHYRSICDGCGKKKPKTKANMATWEKVGYKKKATCDLCGFKCLYPTQMVVFHIDGSLLNAAMTNLRTICLNCVEVVKKKDVKWKRGDLTVDH